MTDVAGVGQEVAGGEGDGVEVAGEGPRRGGCAAAANDHAGHAAQLSAGGVGGEGVHHGLFALAAYDGVEVVEEGLGVAGRQRAAGDQQGSAGRAARRANHRASSFIVAMQ